MEQTSLFLHRHQPDTRVRFGEVLAPNCKQSEAHLVMFGNLSLFVILSIPSSGDIIFREKNRSFILQKSN